MAFNLDNVLFKQALLRIKGEYPIKDNPVLINIRTDSTECNSFDDFTILYCNGVFGYMSRCTCDPGLSPLKKPVNVNGTAIVMNGYYKGLWKIGYHKGKYKALVQNRPVIVFRDNDKDDVLDYNFIMNDDELVKNAKFEKGLARLVIDGKEYVIEKGMFGINWHRAAVDREVEEVNGWSAGCCVVQKPEDFDRQLSIIEYVLKTTGKTEVDALYVHESRVANLIY